MTVTATNGVAAFSGLTLPTNAGYYYTLYVSGGGFGWGVTGTITVTASQEPATFSNLTINKTSSGHTLQVSSSGLSSAFTSALSVTRRAPRAPRRAHR